MLKPQTSPNGMEGKYKTTFHDISERGFKWKGEWVSMDESFSYPTLYIDCVKGREEGANGG